MCLYSIGHVNPPLVLWLKMTSWEGRREGGGGVRRDDRERTDVEGEKKTEKTKVLKVAKLGEREAGNRKEDEKKV